MSQEFDDRREQDGRSFAPRRPGGGGGGGRRFGGGGGRSFPRRRMDPFQADNIRHVDYKDVPRLRRFISDMGKIEPRRKSGANAKHQRSLAIAIKRARHLALLPYTEGVRDPNRPRRGGDRRTGGRPGGGPYRSQGYSSGPPRDGDGGDRDRSPQAE